MLIMFNHPPPPLLPPRQAKVNCTLDLDVFLSQLLLFKSFWEAHTVLNCLYATEQTNSYIFATFEISNLDFFYITEIIVWNI